MKKAIMSFVMVAGVFGATAVTSCNNEKKDTAANQELYECPMKCEGKTFSEPGKCPVCGMDLVKVENKEGTSSH